jgi:hypothetical protein
MADTQSITDVLISVLTTTVVASLLQVNSILSVHQQRRQPPEHRQFELLMMSYKFGFLFFVNFHILVSISVASTFFPLALHGAGWSPPFFCFYNGNQHGWTGKPPALVMENLLS